ncbi:protease modulator HflC [Lutispora sp.]|nr:protease modulator HflC [Lutispora sp.]MEA4963532.1 protease modulator HflC [Lutispora sp.]
MSQFNSLNVKKKDTKLIALLKKVSILIAMVAVVLTVFFNALIVQEDEIVFIRSFGKTIRIIDKPGLYFKIPFVNSTSTISKKIFCYDSQSSKFVTKDNKNLLFENYTLWKINDAKTFIDTLQSIGYAEAKIENSVYTSMRAKLINIDYADIIKNINANGVSQAILENVKDELKPYGIEVIDIRSKNIYLPQESQDAVYSRMKSEKEKIAAQHLSLGEKEATQIRAETDKEVKIIISKAQSESERIRGSADAEAAKIYANSYNKDPEFYKFMRTLESYKKTLINKPTIIIPIDSPFAKYLIGKYK